MYLCDHKRVTLPGQINSSDVCGSGLSETVVVFVNSRFPGYNVDEVNASYGFPLAFSVSFIVRECQSL